MGFDGFIDTVTRLSHGNGEYFASMTSLGKFLIRRDENHCVLEVNRSIRQDRWQYAQDMSGPSAMTWSTVVQNVGRDKLKDMAVRVVLSANDNEVLSVARALGVLISTPGYALA